MDRVHTPPAPVADCYIGLWRRRLLRDANGDDTSTQVFWLQTGALYADLRVPADRNTADGRWRQQGFAGELEARDNLLTWRRWLDFQPPSGSEDVGRMHFAGPNEMVEHGVHADYEEIWERVAPCTQDRAAFALQSEQSLSGATRRSAGVFVIVGAHFMFALDRCTALPAAPSLAALVADACLGDDVRAQLFACEIAFGRRDAGGRWEILHSTVPEHEGRDVFAVHGGVLHEAGDDYMQRAPDGTRRCWRLVERGLGFTAL